MAWATSEVRGRIQQTVDGEKLNLRLFRPFSPLPSRETGLGLSIFGAKQPRDIRIAFVWLARSREGAEGKLATGWTLTRAHLLPQELPSLRASTEPHQRSSWSHRYDRRCGTA